MHDVVRIRHAYAIACLLATAGLGAQAPTGDQELSGQVTDLGGQPLAGAEVTFVTLPVQARPRVGSKGRYQLAQAAHRAQSKPPRTRTDRSGTWRVLLSPQHAALAGGSGVELALRVSTPGHDTWMRAIGDGFAGARGLTAALQPAPTGPRLHVQIRGLSQGSYQGYVLIERAYRARADRSVMLRALVPLTLTGEATFSEPARVPGEIPAALPTARTEGYRVTVFAAGLRKQQRTLLEGRHELTLELDDMPARRVLADRGEAARPPIEATYEIGGETVTLTFDRASVPLLGGEAPSKVHSASGPVAVDAWDPDAALFVDATAPAVAVPTKPAGADLSAQATLRVVDRRKNPLYGAAVWLEDTAAQALLPAGKPYAISGPDGTVRFAQLPKGTHRALVRHPTAGEREVLIDTAASEPLEVALREPAATAGEALAAEPGSLLLDLGTGPDGAATSDKQAEVGTVQTGKRMLRRGFDEHPRRVRLEGMTPGPVTVWARIEGGPTCFLAGALATTEATPPVHPLRAPERSFTIDVRDHEGKQEAEAYVSLGEATPKGKRPFTAGLLPVTRDVEGRLQLRVHLSGDLWVVVHGADGRGRDVLLQSEAATPALSVTLPVPAPPAEAKAPGAGKAPGEGREDGGK